MLQTDLRHDLTRSFFRPVETVDIADVAAGFQALESEGLASMLAEGVDRGVVTFQRSADMRYVGQEYTINVSVGTGSTLAEMTRDFHDEHRRRHGHANLAAPVEFVNLRVATFGIVPKHDNPPGLRPTGSEVAAAAGRQAIFDGVSRPARVFVRGHLGAGFAADGPVIIEEQSATTVVPPGWRSEVDSQGNILLRRGT
jgi:N-methylhydantoinase A